jgi:hypothetical protein
MLDPFKRGGEEASWSGGKQRTQRFLYVSKTLSRNRLDSTDSLKQFNFYQKEILIKQNLTFTEEISLQ